jgi:vacuolar-type H+-ATPase subunit I/STV1
MAEKLKAAAGSFERLLLPRLNSIDGELKSINAKVDGIEKSINAKVDGIEKSISESDKRAESFRAEFRAELETMHTKLNHIDNKLDIDRRMTIMEAKLRDLEKRS